MTAQELIKKLQMFDGDINVDCNDTHGTYTDIKSVELQRWTDREGNAHMSLTLMHNGYNPTASIIGENDGN